LPEIWRRKISSGVSCAGNGKGERENRKNRREMEMIQKREVKCETSNIAREARRKFFAF